MKFYYYPKCSTCMKAKKQLSSLSTIEYYNLMDVRPTAEEILYLSNTYNIELSSFFNTKGTKYKEDQLKEKLPLLSKEEQASLLVSDGYYIKRPLLILADQVMIGYKTEEIEAVIRSQSC